MKRCCMIRKQLIQRRMGESEGFRLRGEHAPHLEAFSDAEFAFRARAALDLSPREEFEIRTSLFVNLAIAGIAITSILSALARMVGLWSPEWISSSPLPR